MFQCFSAKRAAASTIALVLSLSASIVSADQLEDLNAQVRALSDKVDSLVQAKQDDANRATAASPPPASNLAGGSKVPVMTSGPFSVEIYGTLVPFVSSIRETKNTTSAPVGGATQVPASAYSASTSGTRTAFTSGTSNIGFQGKFAITPELRAIFQIESGVQIDGSAGPNTIGSRNTWVGIESDAYGFLFIGTNWTPYWYTCCATSILKGATAADTVILGVPGFNVPTITQQSSRAGTSADASFERRQGNSINYVTPKFAGFSARLQYSTNENKQGPTVASGPSISPTISSAAIFYQNGPLDVRYAYERHNDYFGMSFIGGAAAGTITNSSSRDEGNVLNVTYRFPTKTHLGVILERLKYSDSDTVSGHVNGYSRDAFQIFVAQSFGAHTVSLRFSKAQAGTCSVVGNLNCTTNGLGAKGASAMYLYNIMRNVDVWGAAWQLRNDRSATYSTIDRSAAPGEEQTGVGAGFQFVF